MKTEVVWKGNTGGKRTPSFWLVSDSIFVLPTGGFLEWAFHRANHNRCPFIQSANRIQSLTLWMDFILALMHVRVWWLCIAPATGSAFYSWGCVPKVDNTSLDFEGVEYCLRIGVGSLKHLCSHLLRCSFSTRLFLGRIKLDEVCHPFTTVVMLSCLKSPSFQGRKCLLGGFMAFNSCLTFESIIHSCHGPWHVIVLVSVLRCMPNPSHNLKSKYPHFKVTMYQGHRAGKTQLHCEPSTA